MLAMIANWLSMCRRSTCNPRLRREQTGGSPEPIASTNSAITVTDDPGSDERRPSRGLLSEYVEGGKVDEERVHAALRQWAAAKYTVR